MLCRCGELDCSILNTLLLAPLGIFPRRMDPHVPPALYSVDLVECEALAELPPHVISAAFVEALRRAGATILHALTHAFPGRGLTSVLILSESHAALHTWPETGTVHLDIFSCSSRLKSLEAIDELSRTFGARHVSVQEIRRADGHIPLLDPRR
jgi:S-adenosylmethionine decarboxylase